MNTMPTLFKVEPHMLASLIVLMRHGQIMAYQPPGMDIKLRVVATLPEICSIYAMPF